MNYNIKKKHGYEKMVSWKKDWLEEISLKERDEKTIQNYTFVINKFLDFFKSQSEKDKDGNEIGLTFHKLNSKTILQFLKWREKDSKQNSQNKMKKTNNLSFWTKSNDIKVLKIFFKYIEDFNESNFKFNVKWNNVSLKKPKEEKPHLNEEELKKILNYLNNITLEENITIKNAYKSIAFKLMLYSGLRASELCALTFNNFSDTYEINDLTFIDVEIEGKGGTLYSNPIPYIKIKKEFEYLLDNDRKTKYIINTIQGNKTNRNTIYDWMTQIYSSSNLEYLSGVHIVRHTFANRLNDSGADLSEMQDLMRHSSPLTTRVYVKRNKKRMVSAISKLS